MDQVLGNRYLISNVLARNLSVDLIDRLEIDYETIYSDFANAAKAFNDTLTYDKRAIATGADPTLYVEDVFATTSSEWFDNLYVYLEHYSQMFYQIKKPKKILVHAPSASFGLVAAAANDGCELSFVNNKYLYNFENFILKNNDYPFNSSYNVYDLQDIENLEEETFDMITFSSVDILINDILQEKLIKALNKGGIMIIFSINDGTLFYDQEYHINPIMNLFSITDNQDINLYHMTNNYGYNIIIKN
jgi:hypothetical protein